MGDEACNVPQCGFDGGDCGGNPFECLEPCQDLPPPTTCADLQFHRDGCARECTDENWTIILQMFQDMTGLDCATSTTTTSAPVCEDVLSAGECRKRFVKKRKCGTASALEKCAKTCDRCGEGGTTTTTTTTKDDSCSRKLEKTCAKLAKNYGKKCAKNDKFKKCKKWRKTFAKKKCEKKCDFDPLGSKGPKSAAFTAEGSHGNEPSASNNALSVALVVLLCGLVLVALLLVALVARALRRTPEVSARPTRKLNLAEQGQYERKMLLA